MANPAFGKNLSFCGTSSRVFTRFVVALVIVNKYNIYVHYLVIIENSRKLREKRRGGPGLPTATAPQGVHSQKQWKVARSRNSHDDRPGHASTLLAGSRSHRGIASRRPFLRLSAGTPLCRCPETSPYLVESSARSTMDSRRGHQSLL